MRMKSYSNVLKAFLGSLDLFVGVLLIIIHGLEVFIYLPSTRSILNDDEKNNTITLEVELSFGWFKVNELSIYYHGNYLGPPISPMHCKMPNLP